MVVFALNLQVIGMNFRLSPNPLPSSRVETLPNPPNCAVIRGLLSVEECRNIRESLTFPELIDTRVGGGDREIDQRRIVHRLKEVNEPLAQDLFGRLQTLLPSQITLPEDDLELGAFSKGTWNLVGVNEMISFYKYTAGGCFSKHRDGIYHRNEDCRSMQTVLVYLSEDYVGGRTTLYADDDPSFELEIEPEIGSGFVMLQRVLHEGKPVLEGEKYAIRLDLMYQRDGVYDTTRLENNRLAEHYLHLAIDFERAHKGPEAIEYYKKAFRLNPALERLM